MRRKSYRITWRRRKVESDCWGALMPSQQNFLAYLLAVLNCVRVLLDTGPNIFFKRNVTLEESEEKKIKFLKFLFL